MINFKSIPLIIFSIFLLFQKELTAQTDERNLSTEEIAATIDSINLKLHSNYVFPELAEKMAENLKANLKEGRYRTWTLPYVPGIRRPDVDLYILTSKETFSAAEAFSYQLKHLDRATIIGEKTAGGAHLTGSVISTDKFYVRILTRFIKLFHECQKSNVFSKQYFQTPKQYFSIFPSIPACR